MGKGVLGEWYRWIVITLLTLLLVIVSTVVNQNVYSQEQTDAKIEKAATDLLTRHERDVQNLSDQLTRVEGQVDKLVDHLIR